MILVDLAVLYALSVAAFLLSLRSEKKTFRLVDGLLLILVLGVHLDVIIRRGIEAQRFPITDTYETLIVFSFLTAFIGTLLYLKYRFSSLRIISVLSAIAVLIFTMFIQDEIRPLMPALRSGWIYFHVGAYFLAYSSFAISFGFCLMYMVAAILPGKKSQYKKFKENLEGLIFKVLDLGFPLLTVGIATGAIWASISWGRFWSWDPKEVWALVTWLVYAGCLHLRHVHNLRSKYAALLAALGFIAILFTYIGVNLLFDTIHTYA